MRTSLIVVAIILFAIWALCIKTFDAGGMVHSFLIGTVVLFMIRFMYFKKIV
jgi:multisubunit Na+/H+ antiporter MnhE subunit